MAREFTLRCCGVEVQSGGANFDVELAFDCGKGQIDSFTTEHPALFEGAGLRNGVAVVGRIDQIKTFYLRDQYGGGIEVKAVLIVKAFCTFSFEISTSRAH